MPLSAPSHSSIQYRRDIDGLRAIAVIAVVVYHAFPGALPGGFVGVDVFFVLSGFLISSIILQDLRNGTFSIAEFYSRRIRRIFPALVLVLACCLAAGWYVLLPDEFQRLAKHTLAGAGFVSNLALSREAGYFDAAQHTKPLLHLWSLGIEEQFYIFWPLALALVWKRRAAVPWFLLSLILGSFALNLWQLPRNAVDTFYLPFTRMWELLAGAALAYALSRPAATVRPSRVAGELLGASGLLLLALAVVLLNERKPFPGWWAVPPVLGTVLSILTGSRSWLNRQLLSSRPAVAIGLISYPLYLWHWPLLVYLRLVLESDYPFLSPRRAMALHGAAVALAFLLAWATWKFWETPLRTSQAIRIPAKVKGLVTAMALLALVAAAGLSHIKPRLGTPKLLELEKALADSRFLPINYRGVEFSVYEVRASPSHATLFTGDSHAEHLLPRIEALLKTDPRRASAVFASHDGCLPLPGLDRGEPTFECAAFYNYWTGQARQPRIDTIVISAYWEMYLLGEFAAGRNPNVTLTVRGRPATAADLDAAWQGLAVTLREFVRAGKRVVIYASTPSSSSFHPRIAVRRLHGLALNRLRPISRAKFEDFMAPLDAHLQEVAQISGAELVRPAEFLCKNDVCPAVDSAGAPIYRDNNHFRASKAAEIATFVDDVLRP